MVALSFFSRTLYIQVWDARPSPLKAATAPTAKASCSCTILYYNMRFAGLVKYMPYRIRDGHDKQAYAHHVRSIFIYILLRWSRVCARAYIRYYVKRLHVNKIPGVLYIYYAVHTRRV